MEQKGMQVDTHVPHIITSYTIVTSGTTATSFGWPGHVFLLVKVSEDKERVDGLLLLDWERGGALSYETGCRKAPWIA